MKRIAMFCLMAFSVYTLSAKINFGFKAGYNSSLSFSNIKEIGTGEYNLNSVKTELWNNFHVGIFTRIGIGKMYLQPELLYNVQKKDYKVSFYQNNTNGTVDKLANINTVDAPVLLGTKLIDLKILNIRAFVGPKFKFNAGSTLEFNNITGGNFNLNDLSHDFKKAQVGLETGLGVDVLMLTLDFRYNLIGNMYETKLNSQTLKSLPSNTFTISLGWKLF